jgi:galactonate dehydratase
MKITAIETYPVGAGWKNWLFVRVITDGDGLYGVSEATINGFIKTTEAAIDELAHLS